MNLPLCARGLVLLATVMLSVGARACELCAIYNAASARGESESGFLFTLSEQTVAADTLQVGGNSYHGFPFLQSAFMDSTILHVVPGYNFSSRVGVSLNLPYVFREFRRTEITPVGTMTEERGSISGLGDAALVGRWTAYANVNMDYAVIVNLLGGVKFPTGDTGRLEDEIAQERHYRMLFGPVHAHALGGIHQHDLSPGTASYDGLFAVTANARWNRYLFNSQAQYYLRTDGLNYQMGDLLIVSGGPGIYAWLHDSVTLSVQANTFFEYQRSDLALGQVNNQTGFSAWYVGPQFAFTWGDHFSANAGVDLPLYIDNRGIQSVPTYRVRAGVTWRF